MELEFIINGCVAIYDAAEADAGEPLVNGVTVTADTDDGTYEIVIKKKGA